MNGMAELKHTDGIAYREAVPEGGAQQPIDVLMLHGYPTSSYLWRKVLPAVSAAGYRALAPDLPGFGDSDADLPGTWEKQVENVERFCQVTELNKVALVVHDWGGLIGLRWACDHPERIEGLIITDTGFFPEGQWHDLANVLRTEGQGESFLAQMNYETFLTTLRQVSPRIEEEAAKEYWKAFSSQDRQRSQLDLYRSGEFSKLLPYKGKLATLDVPTTIVWGAEDRFAPVAGAFRFHKEIPDSTLTVLEDAGHFLMEDKPEVVKDKIVSFLQDNLPLSASNTRKN